MESRKYRRNLFNILRTTVVTLKQEVRDHWIPLSIGKLIVHLKHGHHWQRGIYVVNGLCDI